MGINLAAVVLNHGVALVLEALILGLRFHKLSLELFEFLTALTSERFRQVTTDWLSTRVTSTLLEG